MHVNLTRTILRFSVAAAVTLISVPAWSGNVEGTYTDLDEGTKIDLTCKGNVDWIKWAAKGEAGTKDWSTARKQGVTPIIHPDLTAVGQAPPGVTISLYAFNAAANPLLSFCWTDGDDPAEGESSSSVTQALEPAQFSYPIGIGQKMTADADASPRILDLYVVGFNSDMKITAELSGGASTSTVVSATKQPVHDPGNYMSWGCYRVVYDGAGETLTVTVQTQDPRAPGSHAQFANAGMFAAAITTEQDCPPTSCPLTAAANEVEENLPWPLGGTIGFTSVMPEDMLQACRTLRDDVLAKTEDGRRLTELYYEHGTEISSILYRHPRLAYESVSLVLSSLPALQVSGDVGLVVDEASFAQGLELLTRVGEIGSPELARAMQEVRQILNDRVVDGSRHVAINLATDGVIEPSLDRRDALSLWRPIGLCGVTTFSALGFLALRRRNRKAAA